MSCFEEILCVAIRYQKNNQQIIFRLKRPYRHHHIGWKNGKRMRDLRIRGYEETQGFITNTHRFVDRVEGLKIAEQKNQIYKKHGTPSLLFSEDMWGTSNKSKKMFLPK